jgi:L-threonylcarbamoyladenylate synthase
MSKYLNEQEAAQILISGGVVALPTETVYGLACLAENKDAVHRIYQIKNRPADNPLICHFYSVEQLLNYVEEPNTIEKILLSHFTPGPVSLLLRLKKDSPLLWATAGRNTVVARIPAHPSFLSLLQKIQKPIAAPSANTSGLYSATTAEMVLLDIGEKIDGIVDGGACETGIESTIICVKEDTLQILRPGVIGPSEISDVLKSFHINIPVTYSQSTMTTPGAKYKHYAPRTPLISIQSLDQVHSLTNEVLLTVNETAYNLNKSMKIIALGSIKEPEQIAATLYRSLFEMDQLKVNRAFIYLPLIEDEHWNYTLRNRIDKMLHQL